MSVPLAARELKRVTVARRVARGRPAASARASTVQAFFTAPEVYQESGKATAGETSLKRYRLR